MSGSNSHSLLPVYGPQGVPDSSSDPGARFLSALWTDNSGGLWLWGGAVYGTSGAQVLYY